MQNQQFVLLFVVLCLVGLAVSQKPRSIQINNRCSSDFWMTATAGAAPYRSPDIKKCNSDNDCLAGSSCLMANGICFWTVPKPSRGNFRVPAGSSNSFVFPFVDNGNAIHWSGNLGFCQKGTCGPKSDAECDANGCGVYAGPSNLAEFTFSKQAADFYDISIIAGVNVPMSFGPVGASYTPAQPYQCGTAGATRNPNGQWQSSWVFQAPSVYNNWVTSGGQSCTDSSQCPNGQQCGLTNNVGSSPQFRLTCGNHVGYWSANGVCAEDSTFGSPFNCNQALGAPNQGLTMNNLYGCTVVGSCYQPNPDNSCCGCINWNSLLGPTVSPGSTEQCNNFNPNWIRFILPQLEWLKRGCPSCYTYPYDDMSSTFVCSAQGSPYNSLNYEVTLCP